MLQIFKNPNIKFMKYKYIALAISSLVILIGVLIMTVGKGINQGIDFAGGTLIRLIFQDATPISEVRQALAQAGLEGSRIQEIENSQREYMIRAMQDMLYARNFVGTCLPDIDYAKIARGFGLYAERVTEVGEIVPAYERATAAGGPALVDAITDPANVPDSLLSFTLVEFEGALGGIHPLKLARSLWMMRDAGIHRILHMNTYITKAILRINPPAWKGGAR